MPDGRAVKITTARFARWFLTRTSSLFGDRSAPPRRRVAPRPVFAPRRELVVGDDDEVRIVVQGRTERLAFPIDWLAGGDQQVARELGAMAWIEALDDERFEAALLDRVHGGNGRADGLDPSVVASRCVVWMQQITVREHRLGRAWMEKVSRCIATEVRGVDVVLRLPSTGVEKLDGARLLCWAGAWFEGRQADRWHARGMKLLARALHGLEGDGMLAGQNAGEHAETCAKLLECRALLGGTELEEELRITIERACATLTDLVHPDGHASLLFDGQLHSGPSVDAILAVAGRLCGVQAVRRPSIRVDRAGLCGWREGRTYFLFASGSPEGGSPREADALAFEWTLQGERMFVAGGTRFAALEIDGAHGGTRSLSRARLQVLPDGLIAEGTCEPGARLRGRPLLRRLLRSTHAAMRIEDRVLGGAGQEVRAQIVCHPGARVRQDADGSVTVRRGAVAVRLESTKPITIEEASWRPDAGLEIATRRIVVHYGQTPCGGTIRLTNLAAHPPEMLVLTAAPAA